jgi:SpoVK/Ycf46/Vps4 family AAA+-type ATPase
MDEEVSVEETDRIDVIRRDLRKQLGDQLCVVHPAIEEFERRFRTMVGMDDVKSEIRRRVDFLLVSARRRRRGRPVGEEHHRMHVAFVGNPGTGKTSVARLYGALLNDLGLLSSGAFVETDRAGLVGTYVGHTEKKTTEVVEQADGGVLFIDEAYALNDRSGGDSRSYGEEATDVLVKMMEDRRDRLVVVFAGYRDEMLNFIDVNPGLKSRVPVLIDFPDYTRDELVEICRRFAASRGLTLGEGVAERMGDILEPQRGLRGFGNARAASNLVEGAQREAGARVSSLGDFATVEELSTILLEDVPLPESPDPDDGPDFEVPGYL